MTIWNVGSVPRTLRKTDETMENKFKQRKQTRLKDFDYTGSDLVYFVTIYTVDKLPYFLLPNMAKIIMDELNFRRIEEIQLFCYCLMPDHLHVLLSLKEEYKKSLPNWMGTFKRYTSRMAYEFQGVKPLWQPNFYDHVVRKDESLLEIAQYILNNPVRKELVSDWEKYAYCGLVDPMPV